MPPVVINVIAKAIFIAAILGIIRFRKIDKIFYPFIYLCWLAALAELLSHQTLYPKPYNVYVFNIYSIGEYTLITWLMLRWRVISLTAFRIILIGLSLAWITEFIIFGRITQGANYFNILYALVIVMMSVRCLGWRLMVERGNLIKSPYVIICSAFILYFTTAAIVAAFWMYGTYGSIDFVGAVVDFHYIVNLVANLTYAIAILCMPRKDPFTLPY